MGSRHNLQGYWTGRGERKLKYVTRFSIGEDEVIIFRFLRQKIKSKLGQYRPEKRLDSI
jgi:hypothetical protein